MMMKNIMNSYGCLRLQHIFFLRFFSAPHSNKRDGGGYAA